MTDTAIQRAPTGTELRQREPSILELIQDAVKKGLDPAVLKELVALQQSTIRFEWESEERQAKIDFDDALNSCQLEIGRIAPNQKRNDTGSFWADYSQLDRTIRPIYTAQKFSISFSEIAPLVLGKVRIQASLSRCGITKEYSTEITPSTTGPKGGVMATATDADAIAASRAKRYLLLDIFNIAIGIDADEKKAVQGEVMDVSEFADWMAAIEGSVDTSQLQKNYFSARDAAKAAEDERAARAFAEAKNKVYRQLSKGAAHA
jgi:hypothetical protein